MFKKTKNKDLNKYLQSELNSMIEINKKTTPVYQIRWMIQ